jgi:5-methylcytosine-specific restriction enzyme subunit McrC
MQTLDLEEEVPKAFTARELSESCAIAISKWRQIRVEFPSPLNQHQYVIRPERIAGLVPIASSLLLRIRPKVPVENIFGMLEVVHELEHPKTRGVGSIGTIDELFDIVAEMLAERAIARVRKGLYSEYVEENESGYVVRGRLNIREALLSQMRGDVRVSCSFEFMTPDIIDNQIVLWTLDRIARVGIRDAKALDAIRTARRALLSTVTLREISPELCRNRTYNRLNDDYQVLHGLCRFFLESVGPRLTSGEHEFIPFTVNMWSLFQNYVVATIRSRLPPNLKVESQDLVSLGGMVDTFRIDAVIRDASSGQALAVVDAKYTRKSKAVSDDVHQVVAYATYTGARTAVLVYPAERPSLQITTSSGIKLCSLGFPLDGDLTLSGEKFCRELFNLL